LTFLVIIPYQLMCLSQPQFVFTDCDYTVIPTFTGCIIMFVMFACAWNGYPIICVATIPSVNPEISPIHKVCLRLCWIDGLTYIFPLKPPSYVAYPTSNGQKKLAMENPPLYRWLYSYSYLCTYIIYSLYIYILYICKSYIFPLKVCIVHGHVSHAVEFPPSRRHAGVGPGKGQGLLLENHSSWPFREMGPHYRTL